MPGRRRAPTTELDRSSVKDTDLLRLELAARLGFPDGSIGLPGLRREIAKGRLVAWKIAGRFMTNLEEIGRMIERCRVEPKPPSVYRPADQPIYRDEAQHIEIARASLRQTLERRMKQWKEEAKAKAEKQKQQHLASYQAAMPAKGSGKLPSASTKRTRRRLPPA